MSQNDEIFIYPILRGTFFAYVQMTVSKKNSSPYFTWGCADDLAFRLKKTLYYSEDNDCYESSSVALTDVAVSMLLDFAPCSRRKITQRYASSLSRQLPISPCALMIGILYSERLRQLDPSYLERVPSSDLYVVSMLVATKFLHDEGEEEEIFNNEWAEAAGLAVSTINKLERDFLDALDWNVYVSPSDFLNFCKKLEAKIALKYGLQRGWFSYTDLTQFLVGSHYQKVLKGIIESTVKIIGGCALVYGMSLSLLATSVMCYTSTTGAKLSTQQTSSNNNNSATTSTTIYETYADRCLTRERRYQRQVLDEPLDDDEVSLSGNETELRNLLNNDHYDNRTLFNLNNTRKEKGGGCRCKQKTTPCFESPFHYLFHQTSLDLSNHPSYLSYLCNNKFFHFDPGSGCKCKTFNSMTNNMKERILAPKFFPTSVLRNPTLLGMVVM